MLQPGTHAATAQAHATDSLEHATAYAHVTADRQVGCLPAHVRLRPSGPPLGPATAHATAHATACSSAGIPWAQLQPMLQPEAQWASLGPPCLHLLAVGRVGRVHTRHKARRTSSVKAPAHTHMAHWGPFRGCVWNQSPPNCMMRTCGKGSGEGRVCGGGVSPQQQQTADWKDFEV